MARLWCAKEAVAKATGLGFVARPVGGRGGDLDDGPDGVLAARLRGELAEACPELAGRAIRVVAASRGEFVWAWTLGERIDS